jgi:hypothetical protein
MLHARVLALAIVIAASATPPALAQRVVAIGDIHGSLDGVTAILQATDLVAEAGNWTGGDTTFVQTGDFTDRGADVRAVMDLLMRLESDAAEAGGRVLGLLGNHEMMNLMRDVRDVTPAIYATFADDRSTERKETAYAAYREWAEAAGLTVEDEPAWLETHPPGYFAYQEAFEADGFYGRWLREKPVVARIGGSVFVHGGIHPAVAPAGLDAKNVQAREELTAFDRARAELVDGGVLLPFSTFQEILDLIRRRGRDDVAPDVAALLGELAGLSSWSIVDQNGPLWFRGFALWRPADGGPQIARLLGRYDAERFVVGHSVLRSRRITPRFDNGVFLIDTGMLASVYEGGPSALEIDGDRITAVYVDEREPLVDSAAR